VLPVALVFVAVIVSLFAATDDPRYQPSHIVDSPQHQFTWVGFATFVTVVVGSSLTFVTNIADFCRYTRSRRDVAIGFYTSALLSIVITTFGSFGDTTIALSYHAWLLMYVLMPPPTIDARFVSVHVAAPSVVL